MPIIETYQYHAKIHPRKTAVQTDEMSVSYLEWHQLVCRTASWLSAKKTEAAVIKGKAPVKELKAYCKSRLAPYKVPRMWHYLEQIPHTSGGKIARHLLKEQLKDVIR